MTNIETFTAIIAGIAPLLSGGGMWAYCAARHKAKQNAPAAMLASQADLTAALSAQTKILLDESAKDRKDLKRRVDRQGAKITRLEARVAVCQDKHADCEANLLEVRDRIERMLREGPVATYPHGGANASD